MPRDKESALKLFDRGYECQQAGDLEAAVQLYQASIATCPTAEAHTFLGWVYSFENRYLDAIVECKRAIAVDPSFGNPYNDIGVYLMELHRDADAIPWLKKAVEAPRYDAPHFPHMNLARIYERQGRLVEALSELTVGSDKAPDHAGLLTEIRRIQGRVN